MTWLDDAPDVEYAELIVTITKKEERMSKEPSGTRLVRYLETHPIEGIAERYGDPVEVRRERPLPGREDV